MSDKVKIMNSGHARPCRPYDFWVDGRTPLGNPFVGKDGVHDDEHRDEVCDKYEKWFHQHVGGDDRELNRYLLRIKMALIVHNKIRLFCHCAPKRCHAETIKNYLDDFVQHGPMRMVSSYSCPNCGGKMIGDGCTSVRHCENVDVPMDTEADAGPIYCQDIPEQEITDNQRTYGVNE